MTSLQRLTSTGTAIVMLASALLGVGCGETGPTDPTPVRTFKITPAANATAAPATTPASDPTATATSAASGSLALAGINNGFDNEALAARAGSVTIEFDNRDGGVVHNIHFFSGDDAEDESVAETELEVGPIKQTLTFDAQPGNYFYQCDAHPNTMSGTLTVN